MENYAIKIYLKEIKKYDLLSPDEERKCSKELLFKSNLRLVVKIAKKYENRGVDLLDLINEGNMGLMKAVENFNPVKYNVKFSTYGMSWIKQRVIKALANQSRTIRLPMNRTNEIRRIKSIQKRYFELPYNEQINKISKHLKISKEKIRFFLEINELKPASLDKINKEKKKGLYELVPSDQIGPERKSLENCLKRDINKLSSNLSERDWKIIQLRYGLNGFEEHTLEEVGNIFGLSRERIRQIQRKSEEKLKIKAQKYKNYLQLQNY